MHLELYVYQFFIIVLVDATKNFSFVFLSRKLNQSVSNNLPEKSNDILKYVEIASLYEYAFMVLVAVDRKPAHLNKTLKIINSEIKIMCGGAIIHKDWILSSAKCFKNKINMNHTLIYGGIVDLDNILGLQCRTLKSVLIHPEYSQETNQYNIAMLKLSESFIMTKYVNRVTLPSKPTSTGNKNCFMLKLITEVEDVNITRLYAIQKSIIDYFECRDTLKLLNGQYKEIANKNYCVKSIEEFNDDYIQGACDRDVGNPIMCGYTIQGLISTTNSFSCFMKHPIIVTDIGSHINWIRSQLLQLQPVRPRSSSPDARKGIVKLLLYLCIFDVILLSRYVKY